MAAGITTPALEYTYTAYPKSIVFGWTTLFDCSKSVI